MPIPRPTRTPVPDVILDRQADFTEAQLRVLLYVCRRTFGFQRESDHITAEQMASGVVRKKTGERLDTGTGLTRRAIRRAVAQLTDPSEAGAPAGGPYLLREFQHRANGSPMANVYRLCFEADPGADEGDEGTDPGVRRGYGLSSPEGTDPGVRRGEGGGTDSRVRTNNKQITRSRCDNNSQPHGSRRSTRSHAPEGMAEGAPDGARIEGEGPALSPEDVGAVAMLNRLGVRKTKCERYVAEKGRARVTEVAIAASRARVTNRGGWAVKALDEDWTVSEAATRAAAEQPIGNSGEAANVSKGSAARARIRVEVRGEVFEIGPKGEYLPVEGR